MTAGLLLTGCSGSDESGSRMADGAAAPAVAGGSGQRAPAREGGSSAQDQAKIAPADRAIIYQAELTVEAKDVTAAADRAKAIVTGVGGYVAEERSESLYGDDRSTITFKVPSERYAGVLAQLGRDLGKRTSMQQNTQDVTEEVADVASRVKSAEAALGQFRTLLSKANKIGEILEIEREITRREADLESLQARQKALEAQTAMATVTLNLVPPPGPSPRPREEEPGGFLAGLRTGWDALTTSTVVAVTVLGALLPWLVVAGLVWLAVRAVLRRVRRRTAPPAASAPPAPGTQPPPEQPDGPPDEERAESADRDHVPD